MTCRPRYFLSATQPSGLRSGRRRSGSGCRKEEEEKKRQGPFRLDLLRRPDRRADRRAAATIVLGIYLDTSHRGEPDRASSRVPRVARTLGAEPSFAVLPFDNYSGDASQDDFVNGMTEALIADLARVRGLRVISRTSSMHYGKEAAANRRRARRRPARRGVRRALRQPRPHHRAVDRRASDEHIWARSYEDKVEDVLALQSRIATAIAGEVRGAVSSSAAGARRAVDPEVYDLYLRGRNASNTRSPEGFEQAGPTSSRRSKGPVLRAGARRPCRHLPGRRPAERHSRRPARAREAAERALALDDSLGEAHASSPARSPPVADIPRAEAEFKRAIELNPGYATAHQWSPSCSPRKGATAKHWSMPSAPSRSIRWR